MLYVIKVNIILALLCLLFQVVMHRDTFFGVRRAMLWGIYLTAFLLPLCDVQLWMQSDNAAMHLASDYATYVLPSLEVSAMNVATMGIQQEEPGCGMWFVGLLLIWGLIYLIPVVWLTLKLLWQVAYILYLRCTCKPSITPSTLNHKLSTFYLYPRPCSPFSFGPWIFMHPEGMDEQTLREVLIHEQTHVHQWHTADIILAQIVCILFWWNPAVWVMRREVRLNLEFIADKAVADSLIQAGGLPSLTGGVGGGSPSLKAYQYRLLGFSTQMNVATIANNFNVLPLKRRIKMMNLQRTRRTGMVKYLLFVPAATTMLFLSNIDTLARAIDDNIKNPLVIVNGNVFESDMAVLSTIDIDHMTVLKGTSATDLWGSRGANGVVDITTTDGGDPIYEKVEKLPQYPGGEQALYTFLSRTIRYPAVAHEWGVQGRVFVTFVVEKDGTLTDISAHKVQDPKTGQPLNEMTVTAKLSTTGLTPEQVEKNKEQAEKQAEGLKALKAESERVVKLLPERWQPGEQGGKPVRYRFTLPVTFRLQ